MAEVAPKTLRGIAVLADQENFTKGTTAASARNQDTRPGRVSIPHYNTGTAPKEKRDGPELSAEESHFRRLFCDGYPCYLQLLI